MAWLQATRDSLERQRLRLAEHHAAFSKCFTELAWTAIRLGEEEAHESKLRYIGAEHFLLGLLRVGSGTGFKALRGVGLTYDTVRLELLAQRGKNEVGVDLINLPYTPRAKQVVRSARKEAKAQNHVQADTEHLLLGILAETDGLPSRIFNKLRIDTKRLQSELLKNSA